MFFALLASCAKENEDYTKIPKWLKDDIATKQKEIASTPNSRYEICAWIRYQYKGNTYFEFHNMLWSSLPKVYQFDGTEVDFDENNYTLYQNGKCCKEIVWKGKSYTDF